MRRCGRAHCTTACRKRDCQIVSGTCGYRNARNGKAGTAARIAGTGRIKRSNMRILVTGATGFAGGHLLELLLRSPDAEILAVGRHPEWPDELHHLADRV